MSLTLYFHPLSSYCQKALIALYENDTPFTPLIIDLGDPASRAKLTALWPRLMTSKGLSPSCARKRTRRFAS